MRFRKVDPRIWNDAKFRALSDDGKLGFFMLLTHPHMTAIGAMRGTPSGMASEMAWDMARWMGAMGPAISSGMVVLNEPAAFIWLPNFLRYNAPTGPNEVVKAWPAALEMLPECAERTRLCRGLLGILDGMSDAMRHAIGDGIRDAIEMACRIPEPEPEQEKEPEPEPEKPSRSLRKRTLEIQGGSSTSVVKPLPSNEGTGAVWSAYESGYERRYGVKPVRNAKVNAQIRQLVDRIGLEDAVGVAGFFPAHNNAYYTGRGHAVGIMLADAEKLRTEWATGRRGTQVEARNQDRRQGLANAFAPLIAEAASREERREEPAE